MGGKSYVKWRLCDLVAVSILTEVPTQVTLKRIPGGYIVFECPSCCGWCRDIGLIMVSQCGKVDDANIVCLVCVSGSCIA